MTFRSLSHRHSLCLSVVCPIATGNRHSLEFGTGLASWEKFPYQVLTPPNASSNKPSSCSPNTPISGFIWPSNKEKKPLLFSQSHQTHKIFNLSKQKLVSKLQREHYRTTGKVVVTISPQWKSEKIVVRNCRPSESSHYCLRRRQN